MSINYSNHDNQLFPSLSQTPKFDLIQKGFNEQMQFQQQKPSTHQQHRIRSSHSNRMKKLQQHSRFENEKDGDKKKQLFLAWEKSQINQFQIRNQNPQQVLEYLEELCQKKIQDILQRKPDDFDSTEAIDSFLEALFIISQESVTHYSPAQREKIHLSTGARTDICESFLAYLVLLQSRNQVLLDTVEYFKGYMQKLQQLEDQKQESDSYILKLSQEKEQLICQLFEAEKKVKEQQERMEEQKKKETELNQTLKLLKKKYEQKKDECASLTLRIKHMEELSNMMDPPLISDSIEQEQEVIAEENQEQMQQLQKLETKKSINEVVKLKNLESLNQKLATELNSMKEQFEKHQQLQEEKFQDNSEHFLKIQELFNKVQVENKQIKIFNGKLESQLESKHKLITHLQDKINSLMLTNSENVIKMKSQIKNLTTLNESLEKTQKEGVEKIKKDLDKQLQKQYQKQIGGLQQDLENCKKDKEDYFNRLDELQRQYSEMEQEFKAFRQNKEESEKNKEKHLKDLEEQLKQINNHYELEIAQLQENIEIYDNQNQVLTKNNQILETKLVYFKESTYNLMKQIQFIKEDIEKSWNSMQNSFDTLKQNMLDSNNNKDYLISVKKAAKQSQQVLEMGLQALNNVLQIINFIKIEELYQMVCQNQGVQQLKVKKDSQRHQNENEEEVQSEKQNKVDEEIISNQQEQQFPKQIEETKNKIIILQDENTLELGKKYIQNKISQTSQIEPLEGLKIQKYMKGKLKIDTQSSIGKQTNQGENNEWQELQIDRNEEYYFHHCPFEMSSILLKFLSEVMLVVDACSDFEQLPLNLSTLLDLANDKTDIYIEQEIFQKYLLESKKLIESKVFQWKEQKEKQNEQIITLENEVKILNAMKNYQQTSNSGRNMQNIQQESEEEKLSGSGGEEETNQTPTRQRKYTLPPTKLNIAQTANISGQSNMKQQQLNQQQQQQHKNNGQLVPPSGMEVLNLQFQDLTQLEIGGINKKKEVRHYSLFAQHESSSSSSPQKRQKAGGGGEQRSSQKKKGGANAHGKNKGVVQQEELNEALSQIEQLKLEIQEYKMKSKDLQLSLAAKIVLLEEQLEQAQIQRDKDILEMEESKKIELERTKQGIQQREGYLLQSINEQGDKMQLLEKEVIQMSKLIEEKELIIEKLSNEKEEFNKKMEKKDQELIVYKENVQHFVNMKTSNRCTFGIAFEITSSNQSMINEQMIKFYLSKCLGIDKAKLRFIMSDQSEFIIDNTMNISNMHHQSQQQWSQLETVIVAKIIIEIIDDEENVQKYFQLIKQQIRDGSCILYDLEPLYFSISLGHYGLKGFSHLSDFHLIMKRGLILKEKEFIVSLLRHKEDAMLFKVLAINYVSGEEYQLDLQREDLMELLEGEKSNLVHTLGFEEPPQEFINIILDNLKLMQKDNLMLLICEHKIFFNNIFHNMIATSLGKHKNELKRYEAIFKLVKENQNDYRTSALRDKKILQKNNGNRGGEGLSGYIESKENQPFKEQLLIENEVQTDFEKSLLYDGFCQIYEGFQKIGKKLEFKIEILESQKSNSIRIIFEEIYKQQKIEVCLIENKPVQDQIPSDFIIYTHCMKIKGSHLVLISIEKVIDQGLFIKIHDLKELMSEEFFLIKKSSGKYSKLSRAQGGGFIIKEDFRNLIYELTFSYSSQISSNQVLLANISYHKELQQIRNQTTGEEKKFDLEKQLLVLPSRARNGQVTIQQTLNEIQKLHLIAHQIEQVDQFGNKISIRKDGERGSSIGEKGVLLYRNAFVVRCIFEGQQETEQETIISFYMNKEDISVEVYLYKDIHKMSIASQVSSIDLFGMEVSQMSFNQSIEMLDLMMEKLYVLSESKQYHLKVENSAIPISQVLENRRQNQQSADANTIQQAFEIAKAQENLEYIKQHREDILSEERAVRINGYFVYKNHFYEYNCYFLNKPDRESPEAKTSPRKNRIGGGAPLQKRQTFDRQISNAEAFLEDNVDYDRIYLEISDKEKENHAAIFNSKALAELLMRNKDNLKFRSAFQKGKQALAEFIISILQIEKDSSNDTSRVFLEYEKSEKEKFVLQYSQQIGGSYRKRKSLRELNEEFDIMKEESFKKELISQRLLLNQEVEFSEFSFDIKIYEYSWKEKQEVLGFCIEIFNLNDAEIIYTYQYPLEKVVINGKRSDIDLNSQENKKSKEMSQSSTSLLLETPYFIGVDLFNLIDNPFKFDSINASPESITIESSNKKNFHSLFSKYIDNNLMLVVQEQRFPFGINITLIEPSSKLQWTHAISIQDCASTLSSSLGKISMIDQVTIEQFILLFLNEKQCQQQQITFEVAEEQVKNEQDIFKLTDIEAQPDEFDILLFEKQVSPSIQIALTKEGSILILHIRTRKTLEKEKDSQLSINQKKISMDLLTGSNDQIANTIESKEQQIGSTYRQFKEVVYKFQICDQQQKLFAKLITVKGQKKQQQSQLQQEEQFIAFLEIKNNNSVTVKIIQNSQQSAKVVYSYLLKCKEIGKFEGRNSSIGNPHSQRDQHLQITQALSPHSQQPPPPSITQISSFDNLEQVYSTNKKNEELKYIESLIQCLKNIYNQSMIEIIQEAHQELLQSQQQQQNQLTIGEIGAYVKQNSINDFMNEKSTKHINSNKTTLKAQGSFKLDSNKDLVQIQQQLQLQLQQQQQQFKIQNEFQDLVSVKIRKLQLLIQPQKKQIILHRKTYFDDTQEKLIIVFAAIDQVNPWQFQNLDQSEPSQEHAQDQQQQNSNNSEEKQQHKHQSQNNQSNNAVQCEDINFFKLIICDPENGKKNEFILNLEQCFLEEELFGLNRKNFSALKRMAKILVEERTIIKRVQEGSNSNIQDGLPMLNLAHSTTNPINNLSSNNGYSIEINLLPNLQKSQQKRTADQIVDVLEQDDIIFNSNHKKSGGNGSPVISNGGSERNSGVVVGSGTVSGGNQLKIEKQRPEEIIELDEEDEEDSAKKRASKLEIDINHSIIEEEMSQEEQEDNINFSNLQKSHQTAKSKMKSAIPIKIDSFEFLESDSNVENAVINTKEERKIGTEQIVEAGNNSGRMLINEEEQHMHTDELEESQLSIAYIKQLPRDEMLEILEDTSRGGKRIKQKKVLRQEQYQEDDEEVLEVKDEEESEIKFIVRKRNGFTKKVIMERGLSIQEIRELFGYQGDFADEKQKNKVLKAIGKYFGSEQSKR